MTKVVVGYRTLSRRSERLEISSLEGAITSPQALAAEWLEGARGVYRRVGVPCGHREWVQRRSDGSWVPKSRSIPLEERLNGFTVVEEDLWASFSHARGSVAHLAGMVIGNAVSRVGGLQHEEY